LLMYGSGSKTDCDAKPEWACRKAAADPDFHISRYSERVDNFCTDKCIAVTLLAFQFVQTADRISRKWVSTVLENFTRDGIIREKYNVGYIAAPLEHEQAPTLTQNFFGRSVGVRVAPTLATFSTQLAI
jgi:hypothetical protein